MAKVYTVYWKKADDADDDELVVWIDVSTLDDAWRSHANGAYLAQGSGDGETFQYLREVITGPGGPLLRMPKVDVYRPTSPKASHRLPRRSPPIHFRARPRKRRHACNNRPGGCAEAERPIRLGCQNVRGENLN